MNPYINQWYAPAGGNRGSLSLLTANHGSGKSTLTNKLMLNSVRNQVITAKTSIVTAIQAPNMTSTSNSITFDLESDIYIYTKVCVLALTFTTGWKPMIRIWKILNNTF